jgi:hypothetical protein
MPFEIALGIQPRTGQNPNPDLRKKFVEDLGTKSLSRDCKKNSKSK